MTLEEQLRATLAKARAARDAAGRGECGRRLAIVVTELETAWLWLRAVPGVDVADVPPVGS